MLEELKNMPFSDIWDFCFLQENVPVGADYVAEIQDYEKKYSQKDSES